MYERQRWGVLTGSQSSSDTLNNENMLRKLPGLVISLDCPSIEWRLIQPSREEFEETHT
jgi:hypothetical protein